MKSYRDGFITVRIHGRDVCIRANAADAAMLAAPATPAGKPRCPACGGLTADEWIGTTLHRCRCDSSRQTR